MEGWNSDPLQPPVLPWFRGCVVSSRLSKPPSGIDGTRFTHRVTSRFACRSRARHSGMVPAWFDNDTVRYACAHGDYGTVLKHARDAAGLSQRAVGARLGCSHVTVSRWETGRQRLADVELLRHVAHGMRIPARLFGLADDGDIAGIVAAPDKQEVRSMQRRHVLAGLAASAAAMPALRATAAPILSELDSTLFQPGTTFEPLPLARLARLTDSARAHFAACRWRELAAAMPHLIGVAQASREHADSGQRAGFDAALADAYVVGNELAIKLHDNPVAWVMADRAVTAARLSGDPRALARAQWRASISLRRSKHAHTASTVIQAAAQDLSRSTALETPWDAGFYTRMLCCAAYTESLAGRPANAYELLGHAREVVAEHPRSLFGFEGISLYAISVARVAGDYGLAVGYASQIRVGQLDTVERKTRFFEDTAIAQWGFGDREKTFEALLGAERIAPQEVRLRPWAHRLAVNLLSSPVPLSGLRDFAGRIGVGTAVGI